MRYIFKNYNGEYLGTVPGDTPTQAARAVLEALRKRFVSLEPYGDKFRVTADDGTYWLEIEEKR